MIKRVLPPFMELSKVQATFPVPLSNLMGVVLPASKMASFGPKAVLVITSEMPPGADVMEY
jgi:hypothetical protein